MPSPTPNLDLPRPLPDDVFSRDAMGTLVDSVDQHALSSTVGVTLQQFGYISVLSPRWGIVGDGSDEGAKWQAMLDANGRNVTYLLPTPPVAYGIGTTVNLTRSHDGVRFLGLGSRLVAAPNSGRGVYVKRLSNNPAFIVASLSVEFDHLSFDCQGPTHTGWTLEFATGALECLVHHGAFWNIPNGTYAVNINTPRDAVTFNANGYRIHHDDLMFVGVNAWGPIAAIKFPMDYDGVNVGASSGGNRRISNCITGSMPLVDISAGADDFTCVGCISAGWVDGPNSVKGTYASGRLTVDPVAGMHLKGTNHALVGNTWNGNDITLDSTANGCVIAANITPYKVVNNSAHSNFIDNPFDAGGVALYAGGGGSRIFTAAALNGNAVEGFVYLPEATAGPNVPPNSHPGNPTWWVNASGDVPRLYMQGNDGLPYSLPMVMGGPVLATDSFDRADNGTGPGALGSNSLGAWTIGSAGDVGIGAGDLGISANQAYAFGAATDGHAWYDLGSAGMLLTAQVSTTLVGNEDVGLMIGRVDANNYIAVRFGVNLYGILANVGGARATVASGACVLPSATLTYVQVLRWGGRIIVWVGGSLVNGYLTGATKVYDGSPAGLPSATNATKHGIYISTGVNGARVDNWQARRL